MAENHNDPVLNAGNTYDANVVREIVNDGIDEIKDRLENVIVMSRKQRTPDPEKTSLWLEIVDQNVVGDFNKWYRKDKV